MSTLKEIQVKPTSNLSAVTDDLVLRETSTTRLVFRPLIVCNEKKQDASVKGSFVFQRKSRRNEWEDHKKLRLSQLKATEWIQLDLHSVEILELYKHLTDLYSYYQQEGIPIDETRVIIADTGIGALISANEEELNKLLNDKSDNASLLLSRLLNWFSQQSSSDQILGNLESLGTSNLQNLSSIAGLTILKSSYQIWEDNQENSDEEFWQSTLGKYSFILSQIFAYPVVVVEDKAYVGGKSAKNQGGRIVDFLVKNDISNNTVFIELKTPSTSLLGGKYRENAYNISKDISGAVIQTLDYKHTLQRDYLSVKHYTKKEFESFEPFCVIIAGNIEKELDDELKTKSFELYRSHLQGVEILSYDELFGKVKLLIDLLEGNIKPINESVIDAEDFSF